MTKLLDQAIEEVRRLPTERQDEAAELLKSFAAQDPDQVRLSPGQVAEVARRLALPEPDYAADAEVEAFYRNSGA
jgi:hypothetical protein